MRFAPVRRFLAPLLLAPLVSALPAADAAKAAAPDPASLPEPRRIVVPKLRGELTLDGEFQEPVWAKAAVIGPFVPAGGKGAARKSTVVRL